jgi:hypothetical protein
MIRKIGDLGMVSPSNSVRNRFAAGRVLLFSAVCLGAGLSLRAEPAFATQNVDRGGAKQVVENVTTLAAQDPETTGSIGTEQNGDVNCNRSRKRLWVEGEGWIVRRVTTCY